MPVSKKHSAEEYLSYGFTTVIERGKVMPQCVLCGRIFSAFSLKPSKMIRHMECRHPESKNSTIDFFRQQYEKIKANGPYQTFNNNNNNNNETTNVSKNIHILPKVTANQSSAMNNAIIKRKKMINMAGFKLSCRMVRTKCRRHMAKDLLLPAFKDMCTLLCNVDENSFNSSIKGINVDESAISKGVQCLSLDVREQTVECLKKSVLFALMIDETTDMERGEHLIISVRYLSNQLIIDDFLLGESIPSDVSGEDIFEKIDDFFTSEGLTWLNCVSVTISGSPVFTYFKEAAEARNPDILVLNSFINKAALFPLEYSPDLYEVMTNAIKAINLLKTFQRQTYLFTTLTEALTTETKLLLDHSSSRWIMSGEVLLRLLEFRSEAKTALINIGEVKLGELFDDKQFIGQLYFICDVLDRFHRLQNSFDSRSNSILEMSMIMERFEEDLLNESKSDKLDTDQYSNYTYFNNKILNDESGDLHREIDSIIKGYLEKLSSSLSTYRIDLKSTQWIKNPVDFDMSLIPEKSVSLRLDLASMLSNETSVVEEELKEFPLPEFWIRRLANYPSAGLEALRVLLSFSSICLNVKAVSALVNMQINMNDISQNDYEHELRLCLAIKEPRFDTVAHNNPDVYVNENEFLPVGNNNNNGLNKFNDGLPPLSKLMKTDESLNGSNNNNNNSVIRSNSSNSSENGHSISGNMTTANFLNNLTSNGQTVALNSSLLSQNNLSLNQSNISSLANHSISTNNNNNSCSAARNGNGISLISANSNSNNNSSSNDIQNAFPNILGVTQFPGISLDILGALNTSLSM